MWKYFSDISFDISPETLEDSYVVKNDRWQRVAIVHFLQNFHSSSGIPSKKDLSPDQLQKSPIGLINFMKEGLNVTFLFWIVLFSCLRPTWSCVQGGMFLQGRWFTQTNIRFVCSRRFVEATIRFVRTTPRDFWRSENWCISTNFCHPGGSALHCRESRRCQTTLQSKGRILSPHPGVLRILTRFVGRIVVVRILG